jgi:8-oxo-dGTP pyrophosphatase MutT (NUDIX family)
MKDPGDRDLIHTALRETFEEIGLSEDCVDVWGTLPASPSRVQLGRKVHCFQIGLFITCRKEHCYNQTVFIEHKIMSSLFL